MVFHWSLSDSKSPQVSRTLISILADFNNSVVPRAPITIGITITFMFHSFFNSLVRSRYLSLFTLSFNFTLWSTIPQVLSFLLIIFIRSGRRAEIRWSVRILKSQRNLYVSFSRTDSRLCIYHLFVWSNFNFLQWMTLHTQSCQSFHSFYDNLLHSLNMWLIVSPLSPHNTFSSLARYRYSSLFSFSFCLSQWSPGTAKSSFRQVTLFIYLFIFFYFFFFEYHLVWSSDRN